MRLRPDVPSDPDAYPFRHTVRARFVETDAMGVVHHAAYLPWLEEARVAYLRSLGRPYTSLRDSGVNFTVVEVAMGYEQAVRFDDLIDVLLRVGAVGRATFRVEYLLVTSAASCARAVTVHAVTTAQGRPTRTPDWLRNLPG